MVNMSAPDGSVTSSSQHQKFSFRYFSKYDFQRNLRVLPNRLQFTQSWIRDPGQGRFNLCVRNPGVRQPLCITDLRMRFKGLGRWSGEGWGQSQTLKRNIKVLFSGHATLYLLKMWFRAEELMLRQERRLQSTHIVEGGGKHVIKSPCLLTT